MSASKLSTAVDSGSSYDSVWIKECEDFIRDGGLPAHKTRNFTDDGNTYFSFSIGAIDPRKAPEEAKQCQDGMSVVLKSVTYDDDPDETYGVIEICIGKVPQGKEAEALEDLALRSLRFLHAWRLGCFKTDEGLVITLQTSFNVRGLDKSYRQFLLENALFASRTELKRCREAYGLVPFYINGTLRS